MSGSQNFAHGLPFGDNTQILSIRTAGSSRHPGDISNGFARVINMQPRHLLELLSFGRFQEQRRRLNLLYRNPHRLRTKNDTIQYQ